VDPTGFWTLLAQCRREGGGGEGLAESLRVRLAALEPDAGDPDSLADLADDRDNAFVESFDAIVERAYETVTGEELPDVYPRGPLEPRRRAHRPEG
jgi:hypothetical protein